MIPHADALHFDRTVDSFWEASAPDLTVDAAPLEGEETCDVAIVGAGFTGLSAALRLRTLHGADVRVLDAGEIGWGASGRNGGFCCMGGSKLSWAALIRKYGLEEAQRFLDIQCESVALVREVCETHGIDAEISGEGELEFAHKPDRWREIEAEHTLLSKSFGFETELLDKATLEARGFASPELHGAIVHPVGFGLHPLAYVRGLASAAAGNAARLHGRSTVTGWEQTATGHRLVTDKGSLRAEHVIFATNGYTPEPMLPALQGRILPVQSNILVTRPLSVAEREAQGWTADTMAFDSRILLHYFRLLPDGRFLFGGRGGTDTSDASIPAMDQSLRRDFNTMFPAWAHVEHTHFWRGLACISRDFVPYVGPINDRRTAWTALAYHGNGVSMGTWSGQALADLVAGKPELTDMPAFMTQRPGKFLLPGLRNLYLKSAYAAYGVQDRWL